MSDREYLNRCMILRSRKLECFQYLTLINKLNTEYLQKSQ